MFRIYFHLFALLTLGGLTLWIIHDFWWLLLIIAAPTYYFMRNSK